MRPTASRLGARLFGGLPERFGAPQYNSNPVGNPRGITRETVTLQGDAGPRWQHPKLNMNPWSTSYALKRKTPRKMNPKKVRHG